jgi:hypothetical protein
MIFIAICFSLLFIPSVSAEENETANCTHELILCVEEYNGLLSDFREGVNCGTAFQVLKESDQLLRENFQNLTLEKVEIEDKLSGYKFGFWMMAILVLISVIIIFYKNKK